MGSKEVEKEEKKKKMRKREEGLQKEGNRIRSKL